jgi:hypothetical protein
MAQGAEVSVVFPNSIRLFSLFFDQKIRGLVGEGWRVKVVMEC